MRNSIYKSIKNIISFFVVLFVIGSFLSFYSNSKQSDLGVLKSGIKIKLNDYVTINTSRLKLKNIILDRDKIIGEFNDGYYTMNNNLLLFSNEKSVIDDNSISSIEFILSNNWFLNRKSEERNLGGKKALIYRGEKNIGDRTFYADIVYILGEDNILEVLVIGNNIESVDYDLENIISTLEF